MIKTKLYLGQMSIPLSISVVLFGLIIAQGLYTSILLFLSKKNTSANRMLALLILAFSLWLLDTFFLIGNIYQQNPKLYFLPIYYSFGFGPLIFFYTQKMTVQNFKLSAKSFAHFIPVFLQMGLYLFLQLKDYNFRRAFWLEIHQPFTYNLEFYLSLLSLIIYLFLSLKCVKTYQSWIHNNYSEVSRINLQWLKLVLLLMLFLSGFWILDAMLRGIWQIYPDESFSGIMMGIIVLILGSKSLLQINLKSVKIPLHLSLVETTAIESLAVEKIEKIKSVMETGQFYLDPVLTLEKFSENLKMSPREVSKYINHGMGISFIDFVNNYRVNRFKLNLLDSQYSHLSLLGIAFESGFNSKSTFNRVFKKNTGMSPSEYQKEAHNKN